MNQEKLIAKVYFWSKPSLKQKIKAEAKRKKMGEGEWLREAAEEKLNKK